MPTTRELIEQEIREHGFKTGVQLAYVAAAERIIDRLQKRVDELSSPLTSWNYLLEDKKRERYRDRLDRMVAAMTIKGDSGYYSDRVWAAMQLIKSIDDVVEERK